MDGAWIHSQLVGCGCASCGGSYPPDAIRVLARRGDLAFVALDCEACATQSLTLVSLDPVDRPPAGMSDAVRARDVRAMRAFLASFDGDFKGHFDRPSGPARGFRP
jgi:hypothetical protein